MAKTARTGDAGRGRKDAGRPRSPIPPSSNQPRTTARMFVREAIGELRKVQWPTRQHVLQGTIVVGIVTITFAIYLFLVDQVVVRIVNQLSEWLS